MRNLKALFLCILTLGFISPSISLSDSNRPFEKIVVFGASISARYGGYTEGLMSILFGKLGTQPSPADWLAENYSSHRKVFLNFSRANSSGRLQMEHFLDHPPESFKEATLFISVDGLMKDAQVGKCRESIDFSSKLISFINHHQIPLVLGNLPQLNPKKIDPLLRNLGWSPVSPQCLNDLNSSLEKNCTVDSNCFLLDLKTLYSDLESGKIMYQGKLMTLEDFSFDGLHLTPLGSQFLGEKIYHLLASKGPDLHQ